MVYVVSSTKPPEVFDPYSILQVSPGDDVEFIKRQYRKLSRNYHPDLNPDPEAQEYFLKLTNARDALADDVGRENWEKYGHPDGKQSMKLGIALPTFMFQTGKISSTVVLFSLVGLGILLPVMFALDYLRKSNKYTKNGVMINTTYYYAHLLKPAMGVGRMAEVFVYAMEIMEMKVKAEHEGPMGQLMKTVKSDLPKNMEDRLAKLKTSIVKAYMLVLAYTSRKPIPSKLIPDLKYILDIAPKLLNEMLSITLTYHWLSPTLAIFEFSQCLVQAMSPSSMNPVGKNAKAAEAALRLLQLPHFDADVTKKLARHKIRSIEELYSVGKAKRQERFLEFGFKPVEIEDVEGALMAMPSCEARVRCETIGEDDIAEGDSMTIRVYVRLNRGEPGAVARRPQALREKEAQFLRRKQAVTAVAPRYPVAKKEHWWVLVADYRSGVCFTGAPASLIEAEALALEHPVVDGEKASPVAGVAAADGAEDTASSDGGAAEKDAKHGSSKQSKRLDALVEDAKPHDGESWDSWQCININLVAPSKGVYEWCAMLMSDTWVGCNTTVRFKFSVSKGSGANASRNFVRSAAPTAAKGNTLELDSDLESGAEDNDEDDGNDESDDSDGYSDYSGSEDETDDEDEGDGEPTGSLADDDDDDDLITKDE